MALLEFWSEEFFKTAAESLNADPRVGAQLSGIATRIVADCSDRSSAFLIGVDGGKVSVRPTNPDDRPEFTFSAPYEEWVKIVRDSLNIRGEVLKNRVKFKGSMPKMLLYLGKVSKMESEIIGKMRELSPNF